MTPRRDVYKVEVYEAPSHVLPRDDKRGFNDVRRGARSDYEKSEVGEHCHALTTVLIKRAMTHNQVLQTEYMI